MDSGQPPDTNVVRLRRDGDLTAEERRRLASTIFAEQDEVGTFSRGNLVPPKPATPPTSEDSSAPDPFFEKLQADLPRDHTRASAGANGREDTTAYFERLGAQTPAEMSQSMAPEMAATAMPGSAPPRRSGGPAPAPIAPSDRLPAFAQTTARDPAGPPRSSAAAWGARRAAGGWRRPCSHHRRRRTRRPRHFTAGHAEGKCTPVSQREPGDSPSSGSRTLGLEPPTPRRASADHAHWPSTSPGEKARLVRGWRADSGRRARSQH